MNDKAWEVEVDSEQYLKVRNHLIEFFGIGDKEFKYTSFKNIPAPKKLSIYTHSNDNIRSIRFLFTDDKHIEKLLDEEKVMEVFPKILKKIKFEAIEKQ